MDWRRTDTPPVLEAGGVHVWRVRLADLEPWANRGEHLEPAEAARRDRFKSEPARRAYVVARSALRHLLGAYLGAEPAAVPIVYGSHGKPMTPPRPGRPALEFNVSHSGVWALMAFAWSRPVGVDIEDASRTVAFDDLAERYFAPGERAVLRALPAEARRAGFYNAWTRKEAYIKGRSEGLSLALDAFEVSLAPGEPAALLTSAAFPEDPARWTLWNLEPAHGYAGALAVEGAKESVPCPAYLEFRPD